MLRRGFTLIELLVVIAIVAILIGVAAPYYTDYIRESKIAKAKADLDVLKQAVILYNAREDISYQGPIATQSPFLPMLGEQDFMGLQGQYLTNIPMDPWGRNYRLDPYGSFVYCDGVSPRDKTDDFRDYYVKELALQRVEWIDGDNNRILNNQDYFVFQFNKSLWVEGSISEADFDVYEGNEIVTTSTMKISYNAADNQGYLEDTATTTRIICRVNNGISLQIGVHALALKDDNLILKKYREVVVDRDRTTLSNLYTKVERINGEPARYAVRTNPVKIVPKN
ncbi:MAG TPA: prepilin-type N-terminal cleavage/methylation domain-containing protein [Candidatus Ozemobacteraceae bacterium]|nr:prepilin-type N-terminal cleavage/methylation domain-containing protein [Candidatus Ozemobacteraceae bacterium]